MTESSPADADPAPAIAARALAAPITVDRAARTVDVVWSTGARASNYVQGIGAIIEELDMSPSAVRMDRLSGGAAPILNTHRGYDARDVLGRVTAARIDAGRGHATLQFSGAADVEPVWQRIADGTLRSVSVGYRVFRYEQQIDAKTGKTVHRAVDWEPFEISIVAIPVDPAAAIRSEATPGGLVPAIEPALNMESDMPETPPASPAADSVPPAAQPNTTNQGQEATRNMQTDTLNAQALQAAREEGRAAEQERNAALTPVANAARSLVPAATVDALHARATAEGWTAEALRGALWDAHVASAGRPSLPAAPATGGAPPVDAMRDAMADAIAVRAMHGRYQAPQGGRHTEYLGWRPSDMVVELMRARGEANLPRSTALIAERAFHTSSDFPLLLSAAANKMLLAAYQPAAPTYRQIFARRDFRDFKPHRFLRAGDFPNLLPLAENGEIQAGTVSESQELVSLATFGRRIRVTRQMLVNDDLGAFNDFAAMIGRRVADFENATAYGLLNTASGDGPTLLTGSAAVFGTAAARANKAASGTALDIANVGLGRAAVMRQKTLDGLPISLGETMPLLVGPNQELAARQIVAPIAATQISNANVWSGFLQPVVEPLIPNNRWYLFANALTAPVYVYGFLNGAEGPQVTTGPVSGVDGVEVAVVFDFAVGAIDWRGGWFNQGV